VLSVGRNAGKLEMGADLLWAGTRRDFGSPQARLSDYAKLDLALRYALHQDWILQAAVENVLDERYELASGYNSPRRTLTLATRLRMR
jgi:outer membrane cobalamin receptor